MILVTTDRVGEWPVEPIGLLMDCQTVGLHAGRDLLIKLTDFFGGRSQTLDRQIQEAVTVVAQRLTERAQQLGADALVGVRLVVQPVAFTGARMVQVLVYGTAARLAGEGRFVSSSTPD